jgi:hypothetical protein
MERTNSSRVGFRPSPAASVMASHSSTRGCELCFLPQKVGKTGRFLRHGSHAQRHRRRRSSSRCNSSSLQRIDPEPTPTQFTALTGPWLKTSRARAEVRSAKSAAPVSRTTLRTGDRGAMGFLVTITTSRHSEVASSSATAATPTCPVPPRTIAANFCFTNRTSD